MRFESPSHAPAPTCVKLPLGKVTVAPAPVGRRTRLPFNEGPLLFVGGGSCCQPKAKYQRHSPDRRGDPLPGRIERHIAAPAYHVFVRRTTGRYRPRDRALRYRL
jgi:hypothetical protein